MKRVFFALLVLSLAASPCWAAGLKLTIHNGRVSLDAQDMTLRQILTEWARVGNTRIVNLERVTSGPMTLKFDDLPESQALDIILRNIPGYMAAPRATMAADGSMYDRILIMATTTAVAPRPASSGFQSPFQSPFQSSSSVTQLRPTPPVTPGVLPEPPAGPMNDQGPDMSDPAIAAAAAAGLIAVPAPLPGAIDPALRNPAGPPRVPPRAGAAPPPAANSGPTPIWTAPAGTSQPGPPTPAPAQTPTRPASIAPPQADR